MFSGPIPIVLWMLKAIRRWPRQSDANLKLFPHSASPSYSCSRHAETHTHTQSHLHFPSLRNLPGRKDARTPQPLTCIYIPTQTHTYMVFTHILSYVHTYIYTCLTRTPEATKSLAWAPSENTICYIVYALLCSGSWLSSYICILADKDWWTIDSV